VKYYTTTILLRIQSILPVKAGTFKVVNLGSIMSMILNVVADTLTIGEIITLR
jgi:hypothetical protein